MRDVNVCNALNLPWIESEQCKLVMIHILLTLVCSEDRRADPFQYNLCVWNLLGFNAPINGSDVGFDMYSHLSTCDSYVLVGVETEEMRNSIIEGMKKKGFTGFNPQPDNYTTERVTFLSRIDFDDDDRTIHHFTNKLTFPIQNSLCGYTPESEVTELFDFSGSFHGSLTFHEPTHPTTIASVLFHAGNTSRDCAIREAQADQICNLNYILGNESAFFVAGTFYEHDVAEEMLKNCSLTSVVNFEKDKNAGTENIWYNPVAKNYVDVHNINKEVNGMYPGMAEVRYPLALLTKQKLTPHWKTFQISFAVSGVVIAAGFFTFIMLYSRMPKDESYELVK